MLLIVFLVSLYRPTSYLSLRIYDGGLIFRAASSKSYSPSQQITPSLLPTSNSSLRSSTPTSTIKDLSVFRSSKTENGNQVRESRPLLKQSWACLWIRIRMIHLLLLLLRLIRMIGTPPPPKMSYLVWVWVRVGESSRGLDSDIWDLSLGSAGNLFRVVVWFWLMVGNCLIRRRRNMSRNMLCNWRSVFGL